MLFCPDSQCPAGSCPASGSNPCQTNVVSVQYCATSCLNNTAQNFSSNFETIIDQQAELNALFATIDPYLGCKITTQFVIYGKPPICGDTLYVFIFFSLSYFGFL